ncbi:unnamed protein product, partial [marine sediment metagenome]
QKKEDGDEYLLMVEGKNAIYKLSNWTFKGVFKDEKDLFDIEEDKASKKKDTKVDKTNRKEPRNRRGEK